MSCSIPTHIHRTNPKENENLNENKKFPFLRISFYNLPCILNYTSIQYSFLFFHGTTLHTYKFHTLYFFTKFPRSPINNYWSHHGKIDGKMKPNRIQISAQIESGLRGSFVMLRRASSIEFNVRVHVNIVYYGVEASSKSRLRWSRAPSRAIEVSLGFRPGRDIRPWQKLCS